MVIVRCANGPVVWISTVPDFQTRHSRCTIDNFDVTSDAGQDASWGAAIEAIVAHSITLRGALASIHFITDF